MELEQGGVVSGKGGSEPHVVVHLDVKWGPKRMGKGCMGVIEVTKVWGVDWSARQESRRERGQSLSGVLQQRGSRVTMAADKVSAITSCFDNFVGPALAVGEFSNSTRGRITMDLNSGHDKITSSICNGGAGFVGTFTVGSTAFLGQQSQDVFGKLGSRPS